MAETTVTLSTEQLAPVLRLIRGADSVELKLSVPDTDRRSAVAALDMDPLDAQIRRVDTPDLTLSSHAVRRCGHRVVGCTELWGDVFGRMWTRGNRITRRFGT